MNRRRPPHIEPRRPVYIGCEGASERGYAGLLQDLIGVAAQPVHLVIDELAPGAGDPLARIEMAVRRLARLRRTRIAPRERFVLLDFDQAEGDPQRAERAQKLAAAHDISILWQRPCFEALLLRHLEGRAAHQPPDTVGAAQALQREWPEYKKPMTRADLAQRIDKEAVLRAARVEPDLQILLRCLRLL